MANCCSAYLGFSGVTLGDNDGEPIGGASNGVNGKRSCANDGLGGVTHGFSNGETIGGANVGQQDDIVAPQLASMALPLGMATTNLTAAPTMMV
jgi:hypothetical protein